MKPVSRTRLTVITLALVGAGLSPQAGPVAPDPADCFFTPISALVSTGKTPQSIYMVALSGDGKTALLRSHFAAYDEPIIMIDEEFFYSNKTRTLLTHFDSAQHINGPFTHISGPSWNSVDLPFDGSFVVTTESGNDGPPGQLLSLPGVSASAIPLSLVFKVSGNGAWVIGRDSGGRLVRFRREDGHVDVLDDVPDATGASVIGVSYTGDTVCGLHYNHGNTPAFRWTPAKGFTEPPLPEGFTPTSMDASGEILAGRFSLTNHPFPAYWSERGGLVRLTTTLNGVNAGGGEVTMISGNGQLIFGSIGFPVTRVVWTRDGSVYDLASLIRGVDLGGEVILSVDTVSHDGRTIGGVCYAEGTITDSFFLAGLALPGEGPRIALQPAAAGGRTLNFHAKTSFHYQIQTASSLGGWSAAAIPEITGDDTDHAVPLPAGAEEANFFRVVVNP